MKNPSLLHYIPDSARGEIPEWVRLWLASIHPGDRTRVPKRGALPARVVRRRIEANYAQLRPHMSKGDAIRELARKHQTHARTVRKYLRGLP